jgi:hypothetical protein
LADLLEWKGETPLERHSCPDNRGESQRLRLIAWAAMFGFLAVLGLLGHIEGIQ